MGRAAAALMSLDSPLFDRKDILQTACSLAMVGAPACTAIARETFKLLSPRLGECYI